MAMMQIIVFAAIAGFVLIKLYNVLGKDVGAPPPAPTQISAPGQKPIKQAAPTPLRPAFTGPAAAGLEAIHAADNNFEPHTFLSGAKTAYERVVEAYSRGEKKTLKALLSPAVFTRYVEAIKAREDRGEELDTEIIRIKKAEIKEASLTGKEARVIVSFSAEISTREVNSKAPEDVRVESTSTTEEWTFVREVNSRNPNWKLDSVETLV